MQHANFSDNPIVYFLLTDRFNCSDKIPVSRATPGTVESSGEFHGGNFKGITQKLADGWFCSLGINAIWITAPYEQIHGWVPGAHADFKHHAYHGYWALDYTVVDARLGTSADLKEMIDTAHSKGIRIIFDVVMNHPGYPEISTLKKYLPEDFGHYEADEGLVPVGAGNQQQASGWENWWGNEWVRADLPGYTKGGGDDLTMQLAGLPDFRTESTRHVRLPSFLRDKPGTRAVDLAQTTVRGYLISWLSQWVLEYGVDGFRCDSVKHVEYEAWRELKSAATVALATWKRRNPGKYVDESPFWMTGEVFGNGTAAVEYYNHGFDNLINFDFQERLIELVGHGNDMTGQVRTDFFNRVDLIYREYSGLLAGDTKYNVLSYISSHDTTLFPRTALIDAGTALLLVPGGIQIYYGDETARPPGPFPPSEPAQATRSDMNWADSDPAVLNHWRKLGRFRARHVALARGIHRKRSHRPYIFSRVDDIRKDRVIVAVGAAGLMGIDVRGIFEDGEYVRDAYTDASHEVIDGFVTILMDRVCLLERVSSV